MWARMPPRQKSLIKQTKSLQRRERSKCANYCREQLQQRACMELNLLNYLVSAEQNRGRDRETQRLCRLEIEY